MHSAIGKIIQRYQESHRKYHTIKHISEMLIAAENFVLSEEQLLAVWYHDAIYEPLSLDNEERSANIAVDELSKQGVPTSMLETIKTIVLDTKEHEPTIDDSAIVLDLDMAILASTPERYNEYIKQIRDEFNTIPDSYYYPHRKRFVEKCLRKAQARTLYHTKFGKPLNEIAEKNLDDELRYLLHHPGMYTNDVVITGTLIDDEVTDEFELPNDTLEEWM